MTELLTCSDRSYALGLYQTSGCSAMATGIQCAVALGVMHAVKLQAESLSNMDKNSNRDFESSSSNAVINRDGNIFHVSDI